MKSREPGSVIADRYHVVRVLGRGGFAVTYEAEDRRDGTRVAVKELHLDTVERWRAVERFEREARVLAGLDHPRIPRYVDFIAPADDGAFVLVQTLAPGRPLSRLIADGLRFTEPAARDLALQVLDVLVYLHALSPPVVHRDLKPQNLIRTDDGHVMLVDFGAVRDTLAAESTAGSVVGTYGYMAPEQYQGAASPVSDLYGLGATLAHVLSRRPPSDLPHVRLKIDVDQALNVSPTFRAWLGRLLEPAPEDRFRSAADARAALLGAPAAQPPPKAAEAPAGADREGMTVVRDTIDELDVWLRDTPPRGGRRLRLPLGLLLFGLAFFVLRGALARPGVALALLATLAVGSFFLFGRPLLGRRRPRVRLHLTPSGFRIERRLGDTVRDRVSGPLEALLGVDSDVALDDQPPGHRGVALITADRSHLVSGHLDEPTRARLSRLVRAFLRRQRAGSDVHHL